MAIPPSFNLNGALRAPFASRCGVSVTDCGDYGITNDFALAWRNAAGTDLVNALKVNASNQTEAPNGLLVPAGQALNFGTVEVRSALVTISAADIVATGAGKLGNAQGQTLIAAPGAGKALELISAVLSFTYGTAAFTDGGNVTVNWAGGGAAITGLVSAANSFGASANKLYQFVPLSTAANALSANTGINLVAASAFTQPGTAAGTAKVFVNYRVYTL